MCGMITSTFGGVVRNVVCDRPVRILHSHAEMYASTALGGASVYVLAGLAGLPVWLRIAGGFSTGVGLRYLAWTRDLKLPIPRELAPPVKGAELAACR